MNNLDVCYTIGFDAEERKELLEIFRNNEKWKPRIENAHGFLLTQKLKKQEVPLIGTFCDDKFINKCLNDWLDAQVNGLNQSSMVEASRGAINAFLAVRQKLKELSH